MADARRPRRVAQDVRDILAAALSQEIADPRLAGVVITRVETTPDLGLASVYVRSLSDPSPRAKRDVLAALDGASHRLRRGLASALRLRRVPLVRFFHDDGPDARARIDALLEEIAKEQDPEEPSATRDAREPE